MHTIFRIFDACGEKIRANDWTTCLQMIVLGVLVFNESAYQHVDSLEASERVKHASDWNETAIIAVDNIGTLLQRNLHTMLAHTEFTSQFTALADHLRMLLRRQSLKVSAAVFAALEKIISQGGQEKDSFAPCTETAWEIWYSCNPVAQSENLSADRVDNQPALIAYLRCLTELYPLVSATIGVQQVKVILNQLRRCATGSSSTTYVSDIDTMTALQAQILSCIRLMRTKASGAVSESIKTISFLLTLAYDQRDLTGEEKGPTHVAMSKAAMGLLLDYVNRHVDDDEIYLEDTMTIALQALDRPIRLKYEWQIEGKYPPPWEKATTTTVAFLRLVLPGLQRLRIQDTDDSAVWRVMLSVCDSIASANLDCCTARCRISGDQDFDIEAFKELFGLLVPLLGSNLLTDQHRRMFSGSLFKNSIIHEPHPDDLPRQEGELLDGLRSSHIGRTQDLPPTPRSKMAYVLVDGLFDLVAHHDGSSERVKLAQAAAPWLILRVGVVLKAYVLDQPLRGRMPQPSSHRIEMLYLLRKLVELDSEPRAIPDAPGVNSKYKKHVYRVYALVTQALGIARRDREMQNSLTRVIETVSQDFGL